MSVEADAACPCIDGEFARWSFHSRRQCVHRNCERATQPIRLILPDLLQNRLAKLTEHAAHVDMIIIGAVAQHDAFEFIPLPEQ